MVAHSSLITVMEKAARKAAPKLRRDFGEVDALQVSRKGPADFVSNADRAAEAAVVEVLAHARPDWGLLLEEGGEKTGNDARSRWIVDPLDGTTNFLHGMPHFAISIAAEVDGEVVAGLIHQPLTGESFWAEKGRGAWLSDRRLRVSGRRDLNECVIATGIPYMGHGDRGQFGSVLQAVMPEVAGIRRFGAASLDMAWVAAGRFDGFWEAGLSHWDVAAGILLIKEAGGFVSDFRGKDDMVARREIVAGNGNIQSKLHKLVAGALR
ncbi:inositol monophosphatase family protein [Sandarakinorhabdus sp.]|uniref:inositol monophosphatase family protein n=1 Tax=Sandarakinorhabdus sp. TaxID=1916663 RepID=UPI00286D73EA|nr:inositol monophosphatase family protein [Sandarakinorhabdus sp.]